MKKANCEKKKGLLFSLEMSAPMDTSEIEPLVELCAQCGTNLDVTQLEPLDDAVCPKCGKVSQARVRIKDYKIEAVLGAGAMGSVFRARDLTLNREIALKVIKREFSHDPEYWTKLEREARSTALVNHPNVIKLFSSGSDHGIHFIVMELAENGSLDDLMTADGKIPEEQVLDMGIQIAEGLLAAHKRGLIHRDVKPGNILFMGDQTAKIVDFGLACLVNESTESHGEIWGTPDYVAPEKLNAGSEDFRSDIYSLGGTLFHAIAGRPPHKAETASIAELKKTKSTTVKIEKIALDISSPTAEVINRMLQPDPAERYQTYAELVEALIHARLALSAEKERQALPKVKRKPLIPDRVLWRSWFAVICIGLITLVLVGQYLKNQSETVLSPSEEATAGPRIEDEFKQARKLLANGNYEKSGRYFAELALTPNLQQPQGRWFLLHQGMAALLSGKQEEAKSLFLRLQQGGAFSLEAADQSLVNLFVDSGRLLAGDSVIEMTQAKGYALDDCQSVAYFLFGIHNWQLSKFSEAESLFQQFLHSDPAPPFDWITDYKSIAQKYADDFLAYKKIQAQIANANSIPTKTEALAALEPIKTHLLMPGKLPEKLSGLQKQLQEVITAEQTALDQKQAAEVAAEQEKQARRVADLKTKVLKLVDEKQYDAALAMLRVNLLTLTDLGPDGVASLKKGQWTQSFQGMLLTDLSTGEPCTQLLIKRSGAPLPQGAIQVSKLQLEIQTQYGKLPVPWSELSPSSVLAIAEFYILRNARAENIPDRCWLAGVYACQNGLRKQGVVLLNRAAEKKPEYKEFLSIFGI